MSAAWNTPGLRSSAQKVVDGLLAATFDRLRAAAIRTAFRYVFWTITPRPAACTRDWASITANEPEPLAGYPGRSELLLKPSLHPEAA
jgi:hypothetical protein